MRFIYALALSFFSLPVFAGSVPTKACIQNLSSKSYYVWANDVNALDWNSLAPDSNLRPDRLWVGTQIDPAETKCTRLDMNSDRGTKTFSFLLMDDPKGFGSVHYSTKVYNECHDTSGVFNANGTCPGTWIGWRIWKKGNSGTPGRIYEGIHSTKPARSL